MKSSSVVLVSALKLMLLVGVQKRASYHEKYLTRGEVLPEEVSMGLIDQRRNYNIFNIK